MVGKFIHHDESRQTDSYRHFATGKVFVDKITHQAFSTFFYDVSGSKPGPTARSIGFLVFPRKTRCFCAATDGFGLSGVRRPLERGHFKKVWSPSSVPESVDHRSIRVGSSDFFCDRLQSVRYHFIALSKADADAFVAMLPIQIVIAKKEIVARNNQNISCFKSFVEFA